MSDHHSHVRGHLPVNRLFGGKEPADLDDGLPSDTERVDRRSAIHPADSQDPASASIQAQKPRGPLAYAPKHIREHPLAEALENEHLGAYDPKTGRRIRDGSSNTYFGRTIVDELASCPPDNSDIQAPADPAGDVLAELGALAATSAERERRRAAGDDGGQISGPMAEQLIPFSAGVINASAHAQATLRPMAPPNICGAGPVGGDFAAMSREPASTKSAMVRIMELTALVEQARALAVQALTDIGSANQQELAAAGDHLLAAERTITERDARIAALEAAAQSAIEKLAGGTDV